jgi:hypothetical protein
VGNPAQAQLPAADQGIYRAAVDDRKSLIFLSMPLTRMIEAGGTPAGKDDHASECSTGAARDREFLYGDDHHR